MKYSQPKHNQRGSVLLISLMVLLVLTLLGLSSLNGSLLEEKMAANAQTSTTIFQGAESAIKTAYYQEKLKPALAITRAQSREDYALPAYTRTGTTTTTGTTADTTVTTSPTRRARLVYPEPRVKTRLLNSSTGIFVARGIEIVGTASMLGITESNAQGYSVYPMRP